MDSIQSFEKSADYIFHLSNNKNETSTWIIQEKPAPFQKSIGDFRKDLSKLKRLRAQFEGPSISGLIKTTKIMNNLSDDIETITIISSNTNNNNNNNHIKSNEYQKSRPVKTLPIATNPLMDQTVTVIKPTSWIDCISRESKRIFVQDKWIVARILLPPVSKDSIGLKRLTMDRSI